MLNKVKRLLHGTELRRKVYTGSFWITIGFGSQKILQLGSNLILTRLLFPEAFGLMALVNVFIIGVTMFSDMGIRPAIIQAQNAHNPNFLNTAWTLQIIRGLILWAALCILSYPASEFYNAPTLLPLLCFCGFTAFAAGFRSINLTLAERELKLKQVMLVKLSGQLIGIFMMVSLALSFKSVWSLAIGTVCGATVEIFLGHLILRGHRHRLCWEPEFARQIFNFGKWIFWSTIFTFFSGQGVRLIEGRFVTTETLAMIAIAGTIAWIFGELIERFMANVLFPMLSRIHREEPHRFGSILIRLRTKVMLAAVPLFGVVSLLSVFIIDLLYDERYAFAGQVLSILAINSAIRTMPQIYQNALLAQGNTRLHFITVGILASSNILGLVLGYNYGGVLGMLIGSGLGYLTGYCVTLFYVANFGWVSLKWEILFLSIIGAVAAAAFYLHIADHTGNGAYPSLGKLAEIQNISSAITNPLAYKTQ
jgi:Membrane protein involved in the export of O-antigen and teichoic acid